jgi:tetratricopeptide (TPR) repeat protein
MSGTSRIAAGVQEMAKLFLSYAREDATIAERLARSLERSGHDVWWDRELHGGASFGSEIERQLKECDVVIVLWSIAGVQSSWVRDEAAIGRDGEKLLPISVDGTEPPIGFRQFHALDLQGWHGRSGAAAFRKVQEAVLALVGDRETKIPPRSARPTTRSGWTRRPAMLAAAAAILAVIGALYWTAGRPSGVELSVAVVPASSAPLATEYANDISADMAPILAMHAENASVANTGAEPDYSISVAVTRNGAGADTSLAMSSRRERGVLWSRRWSVPNLGLVDLKQQMSLLASQAMLCAIEGDKGGLLEWPGTLGLYVAGCTGDSDPDVSDDEISNLLAKVVQRAPRFAPAWGRLAIIYANAADNARNANDPIPPDALDRARAAIAQTRKLDPHSGKALLAQAILIHDPVKALPIFDRAVAAEPRTYQIRSLRSILLQSVGRNSAGVDDAAKAVELNPLSPFPRARYIAALTYDGRFSQVRTELDKALKTWPNSRQLLNAAYSFHYRYGDPRVAEQLMPRVLDSSDADMVPARQIIAARIDPTPAKIERAVAMMREAEHAQPQYGDFYLLAAGMFGRTDEVFALLSDPRFKPYIDSGILFRPDFAHVRADPRFMQVAAELGLVHYWRMSGQWPDFCTDEKLPYDCKVEAAKYR